jgi:hypothetical protein
MSGSSTDHHLKDIEMEFNSPNKSEQQPVKPATAPKGLDESLENAPVVRRELTTALPPPAPVYHDWSYVPKQVCNLDEIQTFTTNRQYGPDPQTIAWVYEGDKGLVTFFDSARQVDGAFDCFKDETVISSDLVLSEYDHGGYKHADWKTVQRLKDALKQKNTLPPPAPTFVSKQNFNIGDRVMWHDPDGESCSGPGTLTEIGGDDGEDVMFPDTPLLVLKDDGKEVECFGCELEDIQSIAAPALTMLNPIHTDDEVMYQGSVYNVIQSPDAYEVDDPNPYAKPNDVLVLNGNLEVFRSELA